jgi:hypothetical protein
MLFKSATSLFATTLLLSTTTSAAPTRTHCRCSVVADAAPPAIFTPSAAHWTPAELLPSTSAPPDLCSDLGPQLEHFQRTAPDLYASYLEKSDASSSKSNVLVNFAARNELQARRADASEPRPTSRPHQRIVCHSESDPFTAYQSSFLTLWILQIVVAIAILACIVEGVHLCMRWYGAPDNSTQHGVMRFPGRQNLLLEVSGSTAGVAVRDEKRDSRQPATPMLIVQAPNGDRVCITYEEDDDDESNRPVM